MSHSDAHKILIVDDEEPVRKTFVRWLEGEGHECRQAESAEKALELLENDSFSLLILDIIMPGMSGMDLLRITKEKFRDLAVIMVTAVDDRKTANQALKLGAYGYLIKPSERNELLINVTNALRRHELEIENRIYRDELERKVQERTKELVHANQQLREEFEERKKAEQALKEALGKSEQLAEEIILNKQKIQNALEEVSALIVKVVTEKDFGVRFANPNLKECYIALNCSEKECSCYGAGKTRCWQIAGTYCGGEAQGTFAEKYGQCSECPVFKGATTDYTLLIGEHFNNMMHILELKNKKLVNAYEQLKSSQAQIIQQEKMASIGQLSAGVAHEINNPVGYISSNLSTLAKYLDRLTDFIKAQSETIKSGDANSSVADIDGLRKKLKIDYILEDITDLIRESSEGCDRVKTITADLKTFARTDKAEVESADINENINKTLNIVWNELKYKAQVKKDFGELPLTKCYPHQLNQVFMNLLVNASHAIEKQGEINIKTWHQDDSIFVSISDTGCGISDDNLKKIFDAFFTTKEEGRGTGLGLSIAYEIVKKHNGNITVDSKVGEGTTFTVRIPVLP